MGSMNRGSLWSALATTVVVAILLCPANASAKAPVYAWHPPLTGTGYNNTTSGSNAACSTDHTSIPLAPFFNLKTGHFGINLQASTHPGSKCRYGWETASFYVGYYFSFYSSVGGSHIFRSNWWLGWEVNLTTVTNATATANSAQAEYQLFIDEYIYDNTTQWGPIGGGSTSSNRINGSTSALFFSDTWLSIPLPNPVVLSKGHQYNVLVQLAFQVDAYAQGRGNSATAWLIVGPPTHQSTLRGITIH